MGLCSILFFFLLLHLYEYNERLEANQKRAWSNPFRLIRITCGLIKLNQELSISINPDRREDPEYRCFAFGSEINIDMS